MRFAGTCSVYSKKAIDQLMATAMYQGRAESSRRCAYHAMVMKTFEQVSSTSARGTEPRRNMRALLPGDVIDHERILQHAELPEQLAELLVLGVRQVGIPRGDAVEGQHVNVREAEIL